MRVRQRTVRRKTNKHDELTREVLQALPAALNDPMLVYRSPSDPGAHAIVTSIPTRDGPVTAYFSIRQDQHGENVLDAKTIFGKKTGEILEELEKLPPGGIAYANEKAFDGWLASQARSALSGTSHQHQQAAESLRGFFHTGNEDATVSPTNPAETERPAGISPVLTTEEAANPAPSTGAKNGGREVVPMTRLRL